VLADNNWQNTVHIEGFRPSDGEDMNPRLERDAARILLHRRRSPDRRARL
jgi:hypothetical protein